MITDRDPAGMTEEERFAEITEILAKGHLRRQLSRTCSQECLADRGEFEAPCGSGAMSPKSENAA